MRDFSILMQTEQLWILCLKSAGKDQAWWHMSLILVTQEAEARGLKVQSQPTPS
jgi:hypothetical protein